MNPSASAVRRRRRGAGDTTAWIDSPSALRNACAAWLEEPEIGVDTEFVRERTFFPVLGLVQIADRRGVSLLDPLAFDDLGPLRTVLASPDVVKVLHSPGEDLEVFFHLFGELPRPLFDTQTAAALTSPLPAPGYARLAAELFGNEIPKEHTRSDWLRRPLTSQQLEYAALDVAYLLPMYDELTRRLHSLGREPWLGEELVGFRDTSRFLPDPDTVYLRIRQAATLPRRALGVLRELAAWREREARHRDLPRNFVVPEAALPEIARRRPRTVEELRSVDALRPQDLRRHGPALVETVQRALTLPDEELPPKLGRPRDLSRHKRLIGELRARVAERAEELDLAPGVLASRRTVEALVRRFLDGADPVLPEALRGWRAGVLGDELVGRCRESVAPLFR